MKSGGCCPPPPPFSALTPGLLGVPPPPPYSFGQCRQAQPASAFFFCQALPTSTISSFSSLIRPSEDFESSASNSFGALASIHFRASARNAASCGVSSKFMASLMLLCRVGIAIRCPPYKLGLSSVCRYLVERNVLVDPDIAGQSEHAFGDDVAHDLVGAAFDTGAGRAQQHRLEFSGGFRILQPAQQTRRTLQIQRESRNILDHRSRHQLADRILRSRAFAFRQRGDRAHAGVFEPAGARRPVGEFGAN